MLWVKVVAASCAEAAGNREVSREAVRKGEAAVHRAEGGMRKAARCRAEGSMRKAAGDKAVGRQGAMPDTEGTVVQTE